MKNINKQLAEINITLKLGNKNLVKFGDELFKIAKSTNQGFNNVAQAAMEFSKQGLGVKETVRRTRDALILTRISGLNTKESIKQLTNIINSFKKLNTTKIINKLSAVDAKFAVSTKDLANAVARVGNSAQDVKVNFDKLLGLIAIVQEKTGRGGKITGNAIKTMLIRLQRPEILTNLRRMGISIYDPDNNPRPVIDILIDLAKVYSTLTEQNKMVVGAGIGGIYQINTFRAILLDLNDPNGIYYRSLKTIENARDEAGKISQGINSTLKKIKKHKK